MAVAILENRLNLVYSQDLEIGKKYLYIYSNEILEGTKESMKVLGEFREIYEDFLTINYIFERGILDSIQGIYFYEYTDSIKSLICDLIVPESNSSTKIYIDVSEGNEKNSILISNFQTQIKPFAMSRVPVQGYISDFEAFVAGLYGNYVFDIEDFNGYILK